MRVHDLDTQASPRLGFFSVGLQKQSETIDPLFFKVSQYHLGKHYNHFYPLCAVVEGGKVVILGSTELGAHCTNLIPLKVKAFKPPFIKIKIIVYSLACP